MDGAVAGHEEYLAGIFRRCVLALIGSQMPEGVTFERGMLEHSVMLAEDWLTALISHLVRITNVQRRSKPSIQDVALALHLHQLNVVDLERELQRTPGLEATRHIAALNGLQFDPEIAPIPADEEIFFKTPKLLAPSTRKRPSYMPAWMPALPPDHTYMHTGSHSSAVRDLRAVRQSLVEEGRLAERALQRLLGDRGSASVIELPRDGKSMNRRESAMVIVGDDSRQLPTAAPSTPEPTPRMVELGAEPGPDVSPKPEQQQDQQQPSDQPKSRPNRLSLRLSLGGKQRKKRKEEVFGKRPRQDLVALARKRARTSRSAARTDRNRDAGDESVDLDADDSTRAQRPRRSSASEHDDQSAQDLFKVALASYLKEA